MNPLKISTKVPDAMSRLLIALYLLVERAIIFRQRVFIEKIRETMLRDEKKKKNASQKC